MATGVNRSAHQEGKGYWKWRKILCEVNPKIGIT